MSTAGSTDPDRVAIGTPSSGEKPIVVSHDRPPATAVTEHPPPRWHTTRRRSAAGRPRMAAARSDAQATESPWNPYRRTPHSSRHLLGTAYSRASGGIDV